MSQRKRTHYITLQEYMPEREQKRLAKAIMRMLPIMAPSPHYVRQLKHDLLVEAAQHLQSRSNTQQALRTASVIGGGALSILGVVLWLSHRDQRVSESTHLAA